MQSSGIMPKEWETKKFKIDYIDTKGRLVSKELNPKEISDLVFGSAAKKSSELVVENEGYKSYTSKLKDPKFPLESLNLDNPNLAIDPQFNNQTFKIEYYDASGQKHLEPMKLSEVYALLSGDGKLADRPKFDNRDQYLREIAKEVRKQDLGLVYKIYDPDTKANIYSFGDNFESSKDLIHVILNDKDARKFYKYMEDPNHKWSEEKKFQILTESKVSPKLKTKANSSKHNLVVISRPHLPSKSLAKRTQYNFKPRQANNPRLGTTKLLSASYTYSTQSTLSQANEELVG